MPVHVDVPIRIKVDPGALARRACCIESALSAAAGRALKNSSDVVLAGRGGYATVELHPPQLRWSGDGLGQVPQGLRLATGDLVASVLAEAAAVAGIRPAPGRDDEPPAPLPREVSERLDPERHAPLLGQYLISSYDRARRKTAVGVEPKGASKGSAEEGGQTIIVFRRIDPNWDNLHLVSAFYEAVRVYIREGGQLLGGSKRVIGLIGAHHRRGYHQMLFFRVEDFSQLKLEAAATDIDLNNVTFLTASPGFALQKLKFAAGKGGMEARPEAKSLALAKSYVLRWHRADTDAGRNAFKLHVRDALWQALRAERQKVAPGLSDPDFESWAKQWVDRYVSEIKDDPAVKSIITLAGTSERDAGRADFDVPSEIGDTLLLVLPLTEAVRVPEAKRRAKTAQAPARARRRAGTATAGGGPGAASAAAGRDASTAASTAAGQTPSTGTWPIGPSGIQGKGPVGGAENAPDVDCSEEYETRYSALNPESYVGDLQQCGPLLGEPALDRLGEEGQSVQTRLDWLAGELGIASCRYAGNFCLRAGDHIARRARQIGDFAVTEEAGRAGVLRPSAQGNLGFVHFEPQSTQAVQDLQRLSRLLDEVIELGYALKRAYRWYWPNLCGRWYQHSGQWGLAFSVLFWPIKADAVGSLFKSACRILLLQLLESSRSQINARKQSLATYAPVFEFVLRAYFTKKDKLEDLKLRLQHGMLLAHIQGASLEPLSGTWPVLRGQLMDEVEKGSQVRPDSLTVRDDLVFNGEKLVGVQDEHGNLWTKEALEQALTQREFLAESVDPMIKQFSDKEADFILAVLDQKNQRLETTPRAIVKAGDIGKAVVRNLEERVVTTEVVVGAVLQEMLDKNGEQTGKTKRSYEYAFDKAPLHYEAKKSTIPYCGFVLQGIHKLAHEQIGPSFRNNPNEYGWALDRGALGIRRGMEQLAFAFEFIGLTLLSIICPPLGAAAAVAVAARDYAKALENKALFRSLIDPDLIISRAEVEAGLFAAELGLALAFLPHGKTILRGAAGGVEFVAQEGIRNSARAVVGQVKRGLTTDGAIAAAAAIRQRLARSVGEALKDDLSAALAKALAADQLMDIFVSKLLIDPMVARIAGEYKDYASGARGPGTVMRTLNRPAEPPAQSQGAP
jgi:hypothetical protein